MYIVSPCFLQRVLRNTAILSIGSSIKGKGRDEVVVVSTASEAILMASQASNKLVAGKARRSSMSTKRRSQSRKRIKSMLFFPYNFFYSSQRLTGELSEEYEEIPIIHDDRESSDEGMELDPDDQAVDGSL